MSYYLYEYKKWQIFANIQHISIDMLINLLYKLIIFGIILHRVKNVQSILIGGQSVLDDNNFYIQSILIENHNTFFVIMSLPLAISIFYHEKKNYLYR